MLAYTILAVLVVLVGVVLEGGASRRGVVNVEKPTTIRPSEREGDTWYKEWVR
jgi:hypothetical protein